MNAPRSTAALIAGVTLVASTTAGCSEPSDTDTLRNTGGSTYDNATYLARLIEDCADRPGPMVPMDDPCLELVQYDGGILSGVLFDYYVENIDYPGTDTAALEEMTRDTGDGLHEGVVLAEYAKTRGDIIKTGVEFCVVHEASGAWATYSNGEVTPSNRGVDGATCAG